MKLLTLATLTAALAVHLGQARFQRYQWPDDPAESTTLCTSVVPGGDPVTCACHKHFKEGRQPGTAINCKNKGLEHFPTGFPADTVQLELSENNIKMIAAHHGSLYPSLEGIYLDDNQLDYIDQETLADHENLTEFFMANNPALETLPYFPDGLLALDISNTGYVLKHPANLDLKSRLLTVPNDVKFLNIQNSGLTEWPRNLPAELEHLNLQNNKLTLIEALIDQDYLEVLMLGGNQITTLEGDPEVPPTIQELTLDNNGLTDIHSTYFHNIAFLRYLVLSNNDLSYITDFAFQGLDLYISENDDVTIELMNNPYLTNVSQELFDPFLYSVKKYDTLTINLDGSGLNCECGMVWIPELLNNPNDEITPNTVVISGQCHSPPELSGVLLKDLTTDDVKCPTVPPASGGDDGPNTAAIVLGLLVVFVWAGFVGYLVFVKLG